MNKKLFKTVAAITTVLALGSAAVACDDGKTPSEPVKYAVSYALNGGAGTLPTETNKKEGEKFTLASATGLTKENYTFDGWHDGTTKYAAGAEYTMPAHAVTFTAQWKENAGGEGDVTFTVTYSLNGGVGTLPTETNKKEGEKFTLASATGLSKEDHTFDGWNDGTTKYAAGAQYTMPAHDVTLTAVWKAGKPSIGNIVEFEGECEVPPVHQGLTQFDGGVVVGLKIDGDAGKAYYKLQGADWEDCQYFNNTSNSSYKPDIYGADAFYYEIKIGGKSGVLHYVLVKADMSKLYLCDSDDEPMENGEFTMVNINNPDKPVDPDNPEQPVTKYTVTFIKPQGVDGIAPAVVNVESGGEYTLPSNPFTKSGWEFYRWQLNDGSLKTEGGRITNVSANVTVTPVFQKTYTLAGNKTYVLCDNGKAYEKGGMLNTLLGDYTRNGNIVIIPDEYYGTIAIEVNDANGTYVNLDGMQDFEFNTNDGNAKLTFDGKGGAKLGTIACTYTIETNEETGTIVHLTAGGETFDFPLEYDASYNIIINVKITVNNVDYIFGNPPTACVITYELGEGVTGTAPQSVNALSGSKITLDSGSGLTKDGFTFIGWKVKDGDETVYSGQYTVTATVTLVAAWRENGGTPTAPAKINDYIGIYGYSSLDEANGNTLTLKVSINTYEVYRVELLYNSNIGFRIRYYYQTSSGKEANGQITVQYLVVDSASGSESYENLTDTNTENKTVYLGSGSNRQSINLSVNNDGAYTITFTSQGGTSTTFSIVK